MNLLASRVWAKAPAYRLLTRRKLPWSRNECDWVAYVRKLAEVAKQLPALVHSLVR